MMIPKSILASAIALALVLLLEGCGGGGGGGNSKPQGTCSEGSDVADCENLDYGSCGNACCNLMLTVEKSPDDFVKAVTDTVNNGNGLDGKYHIMACTPENSTGFADLSKFADKLPAPFNGSKSIWIGQLEHDKDVINFNIRDGPKNGTSIIRAFSMSLEAGVISDGGQNFKNIVFLLSQSGVKYDVTEHLDNSCPANKTLVQQAASPQSARSLSQKTPKDMPTEKLAPKAPVNGTCGQNKSTTVADCKNVDFGSCGNACCSLLMHNPLDPTKVMQKLNDSLSGGGPDGYYKLQTLYSSYAGFANLTDTISKLPQPFKNSTRGVFIGQVHHMTSGPAHYNDTINFLIYGDEEKDGSYIRSTSMSLIAGALGDHGQNYKNIVMAMNGAFDAYYKIKGTYFNSCPAPPAEEAAVLV